MNEKITKKELFRELVQLRTEVQMISSTNKITKKQFVWLVALIVGIESINFFLNIILIYAK